MAARAKTQLIPLDTLRNRIAEALAANVKSYNIPKVCTGLGLAPGEDNEAHSSKRIYVKNRLIGFEKPDLLRIADDVLKNFENTALSDVVSEMTIHAEHRITDITRRDVLKVLNDLDPLFGGGNLFDGLNIISSEPLSYEGLNNFNFLPTLAQEINQHYIRNDDFSNEELLIRCDALTCSQTRIFVLLEKLLDPVVRRGDDQAYLANALNDILKVDGFNVVVVDEQSGHPIYAVQRTATGVIGAPKNLIFAAIKAKPDLYFTDAINNDIGIRNDTDALLYDRFLTDSGLLWTTLAEWWQEREKLPNLTEAKRSLYIRLLLSVKETSSPGEFALFDTYYHVFSKLLGDQLPALIPQVYLHYDPRTIKERGSNPVLLRQRMDLLLLLDRNVRIVIEVDGKHHYAVSDKVSPVKYGDMVAEDRRLRLTGYELYRFGGAEFKDVTLAKGKQAIGPATKQMAIDFFQQLFERHNIKAKL
ncbi:MAG: hypothetical protein A2511_10535 [Deltaproteobacteria bacterium RIFOXYD12_FULL_50_9]|nr:MAG: hypothetical protein A2511_10535 [Deltaproteobacteria bacterium RIFOXYD12_FULL_50_9]